MKIRIKNLRLRTVIGINDWERKDLQDVIINIEMEYDGSRAAETDSIGDTVDYKEITKSVIEAVTASSFNLLDALARHILSIVLKDPGVERATVEVDKPHALRFADSVSISCSGERPL